MKVCNTRFCEMVQNFSKKEKLKGRGKLGFWVDLLGMARCGDLPGGDKLSKGQEEG